jgi:hypothetical protein
MSEDGFQKHKQFFEQSPLLTIERRDSLSDAVGWLVINSLRGGAAGGGAYGNNHTAHHSSLGAALC